MYADFLESITVPQPKDMLGKDSKNVWYKYILYTMLKIFIKIGLLKRKKEKNKMTKSIIPDIAKMLGVEIGEEFEIEGLDGRYKFTEDSLRTMLLSGKWACVSDATFYWLCSGKYTIKKLLFKPRSGEKYFYIDSAGGVNSAYCQYDDVDAARYLMGNCFRTRAKASAHKDEIMAKFKEVLG